MYAYTHIYIKKKIDKQADKQTDRQTDVDDINLHMGTKH